MTNHVIPTFFTLSKSTTHHLSRPLCETFTRYELRMRFHVKDTIVVFLHAQHKKQSSRPILTNILYGIEYLETLKVKLYRKEYCDFLYSFLQIRHTCVFIVGFSQTNAEDLIFFWRECVESLEVKFYTKEYCDFLLALKKYTYVFIVGYSQISGGDFSTYIFSNNHGLFNKNILRYYLDLLL